MKINKSPWIHQLDQTRIAHRLNRDIETDIAIVGAGIAGISTAFFTLTTTDKQVVMIEAKRIAHGATGHNAGQVVSYFERPFSELVEEFGPALVAQGQRFIEHDAWKLLDEMYTTANLSIPFSRFVGYDGFSTYDQVVDHLKTNKLRVDMGLPMQELLLADVAPFIDAIPGEYKGLYRVVPQIEVLEKLETKDAKFMAVSLHQKGVVNSALFCELVAAYLLTTYPNRFQIFEETRIEKVVLHPTHAILDALSHTVKCNRVVLCTNGFENFEILNETGLALDTKFHHSINGVVARMSAYLETMNKPPAAVSYYVLPEAEFANMADPYFYLTRRPYEYEQKTAHNLICVGGPQHDIADREEYLYEFDYPDEVQAENDRFIKKIYDLDPNKKIDYQFSWHGLMGYTPNRVRLIGAEPKNPILLYNLGCNGVGILPSIYGGKRISQILAGEQLSPSMFDPREK